MTYLLQRANHLAFWPGAMGVVSRATWVGIYGYRNILFVRRCMIPTNWRQRLVKIENHGSCIFQNGFTQTENTELCRC